MPQDRKRLEEALIAADAAGDVEAAKVLAKEIRRLSSQDDRKPIDVEANRRQAVGEFVESLPWYERLGIGVREPIARAGQRVERALGIEQTPEQKTGPAAPIPPELSAGADDLATNFGRTIPAVAALARVPGALPGASRLPAAARVVANVLPSAAASGAYGAITSEDPTSGAIGSAAGGAAGSLAAAGAGRLGNAVVGRWADRAVQGSDDLVRTLDDFQRLGGKLTPGAASGGRATQFVDEALSNNPLTATPYAAIERNNQVLLNRTLTRALGLGDKADEIGPSALRAADDVISQEFNAVARQIPEVTLPEGAADDVVDLLSARTVKPFLARLQAGNITGRDYMELRSKLLEITRRQGSDKVDDAWDLIETLDDAAEAVAPASYKPAYAAARERYKTLLAVDKYRRGVTGGDANAPTLEGAVRSIFGKQYTRDASTVLPETKDFFTVIRAMTDPRLAALTGGSPTAKRLMPWVTTGAIGGGFALDPLSTAAAVGGSVLGSRAYLAAPAGPAARRVGGVLGGAAGAQVPPLMPDERQ